MAKETNKTFASLPKPIDLKAPDAPDGAKKGRRSLPEIDPVPVGVQKNDETERPPTHRPPPPPPPLRPGDLPQRRKPQQEAPPKPKRKPSPFRRISKFIVIPPVVASIVAWSIAGIAMIAIAIWFITGLLVDNAFAVYLDDERIGYIALADDLTSEDFHNQAVLSLQAARRGVRVNVNERVTIEPTRTAARNLEAQGDIIARLNRAGGFTFTIAAHEIWVNDSFEALLRTQSDLNHVRFLLEEHWRNENTVAAEIIGGWEVRTVYVCPDEYDDEFDSPEEAYFRLDRFEMQVYEYTVVSGDNLSAIALRFGTTVDRIMGHNSLTTTNLTIGQSLLIYTQMPLLSVLTIDETYTTEAIEAPVITNHNADLPRGVPNIVQQGQPGLARVIERVERVNGVERSRTTLDPEVEVEPIAHIIEEGTGAAVTERR